MISKAGLFFLLMCIVAPSADAAASGRVTDSSGRPLAGARIKLYGTTDAGERVRPQTRTDAQGRYSLRLVPGMYSVAQAWYPTRFRGKPYNLPLYLVGENTDDFDASAGHTANFVLKVSGLIAEGKDAEDPESYYGGHIVVNVADDLVSRPHLDGTRRVSVRLVPQGPLMDGTAGQTIATEIINTPSSLSRTIRDVPLGAYMVSAALRNADGSETPLNVLAQSVGSRAPVSTPALQAPLVFEPNGSREPGVLANNGVAPMNLTVLLPGSRSGAGAATPSAPPARDPVPPASVPTPDPVATAPTAPAEPVAPAAPRQTYQVGDRIEHYNWMNGTWSPGVIKAIRPGYNGAKLYVVDIGEGHESHLDADKLRPASSR